MSAVPPVANNLFLHEACDGDTPEHRETLARSAYNLIGVCEAIIDRVPEEEAERVMALLTEEMENAARLSVPLTVEAHCARSWAEAH